jgi:tRNA dimethylallyltransferase
MEMPRHKTPLAVITGPTGSGKSELGYRLIDFLSQQKQRAKPIEIVCCDSMLVYQDLDIGTAKPKKEILEKIPHHCLNLIAFDQSFDVGDYLQSAQKAIAGINQRGALPLVIGGTGLYLRALTQGLLQLPKMDPSKVQDFRKKIQDEYHQRGDSRHLYVRLQEIDPASAQRIQINDLYRITRALEIFEFTGKPLSSFQEEHGFREEPYETIMIALDWPRQTLYERIHERLDQMLAEGLEQELKDRLEQNPDPQNRSLQGLAYRFFTQALQKEISWVEAIEKTQKETRRFAKRQLTWFRSLKTLHWLKVEKTPLEALEEALSLFEPILYEPDGFSR